MCSSIWLRTAAYPLWLLCLFLVAVRIFLFDTILLFLKCYFFEKKPTHSNQALNDLFWKKLILCFLHIVITY